MRLSVVAALLVGFVAGNAYHLLVDAIVANTRRDTTTNTHDKQDHTQVDDTLDDTLDATHPLRAAPHLTPDQRLQRLESQLADLLDHAKNSHPRRPAAAAAAAATTTTTAASSDSTASAA